MKSFRKVLTFHTNERREFVNITSLVEECLYESGIKEDILLCNESFSKNYW